MLLAVVALLGYTLTTHLRAREWSHPYRFAASEAAKHPESPRAAYALGQALTIMSGYNPESPFLPLAVDALERARTLPGSGILPHSGLLLLAENAGLPMRTVWWDDLHQRLSKERIGPQEVNAIGALTNCARRGTCDFPNDQMLRMFMVVLEREPIPQVLTMYGDYALNVLHDQDLALHAWREAVRISPREAQYRINLIRLLTAVGHTREAEREIGRLKRLGIPGQHAAVAKALTVDLKRERAH